MTLSKYIVLAGSSLLLATGCGPMQSPMASRLDDDQQNRIDLGWETALTPVEKLDHQNWLDVFVISGIYQFGVDKLYFRSEKQFSAGFVIMEVHFDRTKPDDDRFEVAICDVAGKVLRKERYNREEVMQTFRELTEQTAGDRSTPEGAAKQAERIERLERVINLFPEANKHTK